MATPLFKTPIHVLTSLDSNYGFIVIHQPKNSDKLYYSVNFNNTEIVDVPKGFFQNSNSFIERLATLEFETSPVPLDIPNLDIFSLGGPEIPEVLLDFIRRESFQSKFNNIKLVLSSKFSINRSFNLYDEYMKVVLLQESVRRFIRMERPSKLFGGWSEITQEELQLYKYLWLFKRNMLGEHHINQLKKTVSEIIFRKQLSEEEIKNTLQEDVSLDLLAYLAIFIINPRYFVRAPYLYNFIKVYNYLGLVKFDIFDTIYRNKSDFQIKLKMRKIISQLLQVKTPDNKKNTEKQFIKSARKKLWKILSAWMTAQAPPETSNHVTPRQ